jgi:hypothetical protein
MMAAPRRSLLGKTYLAIWLAVGGISAGVVAAVLSDDSPRQHEAARNEAQLAKLDADLSNVRSDVSKLHTRISEIDAGRRTLAERVSNVEERVQAMPMAAATGAPQTSAANPIVTGSVPAATPAPSAQLKPAMPVLPPLTLAPPQASAPPPPEKPKKFGVKLSTGKSLEELRLSWLMLGEKHSAEFGKLTANYTRSRSKSEAPYQLIAGPLDTEAAARQVCGRLAAQGVPCAPSQFSGSALPDG